MRLNFPALILTASTLALAACSTAPQPPRGHSPRVTTPPAAKPSPQVVRPRWQPAPVKADGAYVTGGRRHIVKRGETGIAIARAYGVSWNQIASANKIDREATIQVGQALFIPTGQTRQSTQGASQSAQTRPDQNNRPRLGPNATPEEHAAAFQLDIDDLITGSAPAVSAPKPQPRPTTATATATAKAATKPAANATGKPASKATTGTAQASATAPKPVTPATQPAATAGIPSLLWPVDGRVILSRYGPKAGGRVNDGLNIKAVRGSSVRAAAAGEVIYVGDAIAGYGLMMLVRHTGGVVTAYAHLEDALADRGDKVQRGQMIARVGSSGSVDEPQLHFQLRQGRNTLDPARYLPR